MNDSGEIKKRETIAIVRGHLEGYADVLDKLESWDRERLIEALRADAETLTAVSSLEDA